MFLRATYQNNAFFFFIISIEKILMGKSNFIEFKIYNLFMDRHEFEVFFKLPHLFILNQLKHDLIILK